MKIIYSNTPSNFHQLVKQVFIAYPGIFKSSWYLYAIFAILTSGLTYLIPRLIMPVVIILTILGIIIALVLYALIIVISDRVLAGKKISFRECFIYTKNRFLALLGAIGYLILASVGLVLIAMIFIALGKAVGLPALLNAVGALIIIFTVLLLYLFFPLVILEQKNLLESLQKSAKLFMTNSWYIVGMLVVIVLFMVIIAIPFAAIMTPLKDKPLYSVGHFLFNLVTYPIAFSSILILLHDSNLRLRNSKLKS